MTNLRIREVAKRNVSDLADNKGAKQEAVVNLSAAKMNPEKKAASRNGLMSSTTLVQGMVWHEILSGPLCKRRRNK